MPEETAAERAERRRRLQFLCNSKDPEAVKCRLYVTGFKTDNVKRPELMEVFSPFGRVYDLAIYKGFVFVQYDNMQSSQAAIDKLDRKPYKEGKLLVKFADKSRKEQAAEKETCRYYAMGKCMRGSICHFAHDEPAKPKTSGPNTSSIGDRIPEETARRYDHMDREESRMAPERTFAPPQHERLPLKRPLPAEYDDVGRPPLRPALDPYLDRSVHTFAPPLLSRREPPLPSRREPTAIDLRPPFDCIIIAGDEKHRPYCQMINQHLEGFGMLTHIQIVDGEHMLKNAIEEASRHTVPYTISVNTNNEEHQSVTLNILHGVAQEHRNMPLDDAMPFLSRNFDQFVDMMKKKIATINDWIPPDSKVTYLLNLLADGRRLTVPELEEIHAYVTGALSKLKGARSLETNPANGVQKSVSIESDRITKSDSIREHRTLLPQPGRSENASPPIKDNNDYALSGTMQDLLKARDRRPNEPLSARGYSSPPGSTSSGINFDNPAVKRALDDLMSTRTKPGTSGGGYGFMF